MNLRIIEYISAIGRHGSMTEAAKELFITSSALNQQLLKLERDLGVQLFIRAKHKLIPTEAGEICLRGIQNMLDKWEETRTELQEISGSVKGLFKMGLTYDHGSEVFARIWPKFHEKFPGIRIQCYQLLVPELINMVQNGEIDASFLLAGKPENISVINYLPISSENLLLGLPVNHKFLTGRENKETPNPAVNLSNFSDDSFALALKKSTMRAELIDPLFQSAGFEPNIMVESSFNAFLEKLTSEGVCNCIIPQSQVKDRKNIIWFYLPGSPRFHFGLGYAKGRKLNSAMKYFVSLAKEDAKKFLHFSTPEDSNS